MTWTVGYLRFMASSTTRPSTVCKSEAIHPAPGARTQERGEAVLVVGQAMWDTIVPGN